MVYNEYNTLNNLTLYDPGGGALNPPPPIFCPRAFNIGAIEIVTLQSEVCTQVILLTLYDPGGGGGSLKAPLPLFALTHLIV